jgi:hypothetical protein
LKRILDEAIYEDEEFDLSKRCDEYVERLILEPQDGLYNMESPRQGERYRYNSNVEEVI